MEFDANIVSIVYQYFGSTYNYSKPKYHITSNPPILTPPMRNSIALCDLTIETLMEYTRLHNER